MTAETIVAEDRHTLRLLKSPFIAELFIAGRSRRLHVKFMVAVWSNRDGDGKFVGNAARHVPWLSTNKRKELVAENARRALNVPPLLFVCHSFNRGASDKLCVLLFRHFLRYNEVQHWPVLFLVSASNRPPFTDSQIVTNHGGHPRRWRGNVNHLLSPDEDQLWSSCCTQEGAILTSA